MMSIRLTISSSSHGVVFEGDLDPKAGRDIFGEAWRRLLTVDEGAGASPPAEQGRKPGSDHLVDGGIDAAPRSTGE